MRKELSITNDLVPSNSGQNVGIYVEILEHLRQRILPKRLNN
jgi:hypothetical protein